MAVNCGAIHPDLVAGELFGYVKGAFTGAQQDRDGLFAAADGGDIFLDEIATLPMNVQTALLRVLGSGEYSPVGSTKTKKVNVRIIAATNEDLTKAIAQ